MRKKLKAVIFDLDGVLTDTASYHYKGWKRLADELNIPFDEKANENLKGIDRMGSLNKILESSKCIYSYEEKLALCDKKNRYYQEYIKGITEKDLLIGVNKVLIDLKEKEIKIGLASVSKNAFSVVEKLMIVDYFDYIADANKILKGKPDPEIFMTCAEGLGVKIEECLGIEDAAAGVTAIKRAGMIAVGIGNKGILQEADVVLESLEAFDINEMIERFF
ncbi:beta-phosphoglucomutase [Anaerovirgula multivorans]|uniref:Beta-phosphoglucomutase n=1 Tax=Anaerovirgula multivorans TaxID=312168 RepID=A0A239AHL8_9FIRM|nr:beta-phosphoglucomutase [Anaerovirgula multivorans]SNR95029.1 beta-phosphoglucomutase [Anaerovirgula multivorans]